MNHAMPQVMPILSAGRHRNPRSGACFMEFASYLAGERWSDHPACTHPLLATLARDVNDLTTDAARSQLASLIHRVVGLNGDHPMLAPAIVLRASTAALPIASMERQNALAVSAIVVLAENPDPELDALVHDALEQTPAAEAWARQFLAELGTRRGHHRGRDDSIIHSSVVAIATACVQDPDARLAALLESSIHAAERLLRPEISRKSVPAFVNA